MFLCYKIVRYKLFIDCMTAIQGSKVYVRHRCAEGFGVLVEYS